MRLVWEGHGVRAFLHPSNAALLRGAMAPKKRSLADALSASSSGAPSPAQPKRRLSRRSTEEAVRRAAADHLGSLSDLQKHHKRVDGRTLHETLLEQRRLLNQKKGRMGPTFWAKVKSDFGIEDVGVGLIIENEDEALDSTLQEALRMATLPSSSQRSRALLGSWLTTATEVNQKTVVALFRFVVSLAVGVNKRPGP